MPKRFVAPLEYDGAGHAPELRGVWRQFSSIATRMALIVDALTPMAAGDDHLEADEARLILQGRACSAILSKVLRSAALLAEAPSEDEQEDSEGLGRLIKEIETYWRWIDEDGLLSGDYDEESLEALSDTLRRAQAWFDGLGFSAQRKVDCDATAIARLAVLENGDLPEIYRLLVHLPDEARAAFEFALSGAPLLDILCIAGHFAGEFAQADQSAEKDALLRLVDCVIAQHPEPKALQERLTAFVDHSSDSELETWLPNLPRVDATLAMQLLNHIATKVAPHDIERLTRTYNLAAAIARAQNDLHAEAIVHHQHGHALLERGDAVLAERAFARADQMVGNKGSRLLMANALAHAKAIGHLLVAKAPLPPRDEIDRLLSVHPDVAGYLAPLLATAAIDREDLVEAENYMSRIRQSDQNWQQKNPAAALVGARMLRWRGNFEHADRLLVAVGRTAADTPHVKAELERQVFFFERDLNPSTSENEALLERASERHDANWARYQQGLLLVQRGQTSEANALFRLVLPTCDGDQRASCLGMIAATSADPIEASRLAHEAIGLFYKSGRKIEHARALSNLASTYVLLARFNISRGMPPALERTLSAAAALLAAADRIAEAAGAFGLMISLRLSRARVAALAEARLEALSLYASAFEWLEREYLAFAASARAEQHLGHYLYAYDEAVTCALDAMRPDIALALSDRSKALRLTRGFGNDSGDIEDRRLWRRVLQGYGLAPEERSQLNGPTGTMAARTSTGWPYADHLRASFAAMFPAISPSHALAELGPVMPAPLQGGMICETCAVCNTVESTYCSACEARLLKSAVNFTFDPENPRLFADHLYNQAIVCLSEGEFSEAERLLRRALEDCFHPDYTFFLGYCQLVRNAPTEAKESLDACADRQFSEIIPFWPLPISPSRFKAAMQFDDDAKQMLLVLIDGMNKHRLDPSAA